MFNTPGSNGGGIFNPADYNILQDKGSLSNLVAAIKPKYDIVKISVHVEMYHQNAGLINHTESKNGKCRIRFQNKESTQYDDNKSIDFFSEIGYQSELRYTVSIFGIELFNEVKEANEDFIMDYDVYFEAISRTDYGYKCNVYLLENKTVQKNLGVISVTNVFAAFPPNANITYMCGLNPIPKLSVSYVDNIYD